MLMEIQKYDYYILVDHNQEESEESDQNSEDNGIVVNKLETNQRLIAQIVKNYSEQRKNEERIVLSDISHQDQCCSLGAKDKKCLCNMDIY